MRVAVLELPSLPDPEADALKGVADLFGPADAVLLNEMPFGPWLAERDEASDTAAAHAVGLHDAGIAALGGRWPGRLVFGTAPVRAGRSLVNEAFSLAGGRRVARHVKSRLPHEPGWWERSWFAPGTARPQVFEVGGLRFAFLICSELMYTELARGCLREQVDVLLAPRATGGDCERWIAAGSMAAIWTGAYVLSSNRRGGAFNGAGFAIAPDGSLIGRTDPDRPVLSVAIDTAATAAGRERYPCTMEFGGLGDGHRNGAGEGL